MGMVDFGDILWFRTGRHSDLELHRAPIPEEEPIPGEEPTPDDEEPPPHPDPVRAATHPGKVHLRCRSQANPSL